MPPVHQKQATKRCESCGLMVPLRQDGSFMRHRYRENKIMYHCPAGEPGGRVNRSAVLVVERDEVREAAERAGYVVLTQGAAEWLCHLIHAGHYLPAEYERAHRLLHIEETE